MGKSNIKEAALVTGASSGIGMDIARILAEQKIDLVISARRKDLLIELKKELEETHKIRVDVVENDLSKPQGAQELYSAVRAIRKDTTIVVNNAGFGKQGPLVEHTMEEIHSLLQVNITALTELTRLFAADMKEMGFGRFLQVSSIGAFQPTPYYGIYSAAKSYVLSFSCAINSELKGSGVSSTALCPGMTETEFHKVAGHEKTTFMKLSTMSSKKVAAIGVRAMFRRKSKVIPGIMNKINSYLMESMPRFLSTAIAGSMMKT